VTREKQRLKKILDKYYREYNFKRRIPHDPIEFPHRYKNPEDIEVSGFIASCLAYGKVELFKPVVEKILSRTGGNPHAFFLDFDAKRDGPLFSFKYRFNESRDIVCLLFIIHKLLVKYSSLNNAFMRHYRSRDENMANAISGFINDIMSINTMKVYRENIHPPGLTQLFPSPVNGSACKRMNLFLRWMIRHRDIDFGIWDGIPENKLVIPLDTHIARIARCLGLTSRRSSDWKTAVEITDALKTLDPEDPLKYDFALCHHGISGLCKQGVDEGCRQCRFSGSPQTVRETELRLSSVQQ
jgi:uncharacterized protein (TIGR02757 family)